MRRANYCQYIKHKVFKQMMSVVANLFRVFGQISAAALEHQKRLVREGNAGTSRTLTVDVFVARHKQPLCHLVAAENINCARDPSGSQGWSAASFSPICSAFANKHFRFHVLGEELGAHSDVISIGHFQLGLLSSVP